MIVNVFLATFALAKFVIFSTTSIISSLKIPLIIIQINDLDVILRLYDVLRDYGIMDEIGLNPT